MNRLAREFASQRTPRLLPYVTAGYPSIDATLEILRGLSPRRCAAVELGLPFSDPVADGPIIQTSFTRALQSGFRVADLFDALAREPAAFPAPLIAMVSYSIVYRRGPDAFLDDLVRAGIDGLLVPDLPVEEAERLAPSAAGRRRSLILMIAPTTDRARRARIAALSSPFVYLQARTGVTGERAALADDLDLGVRDLRAECGKPVCVGFGVSTAAQVARVCRAADGAIVGSAIVRRMNESVERGATAHDVAAAALGAIEELSAGLSVSP